MVPYFQSHRLGPITARVRASLNSGIPPLSFLSCLSAPKPELSVNRLPQPGLMRAIVRFLTLFVFFPSPRHRRKIRKSFFSQKSALMFLPIFEHRIPHFQPSPTRPFSPSPLTLSTVFPRTLTFNSLKVSYHFRSFLVNPKATLPT